MRSRPSAAVRARFGRAVLATELPETRQMHGRLPVTLVAQCRGRFIAYVDGRPLASLATTLKASDLGAAADVWVGQPRGAGTFASNLNGDPFSQATEQQLVRPGSLGRTSWHHLAVVLDGDTSGRMYIDGDQVATSMSMTIKPADLGSTLYDYMGRSQYDVDPYLSGRLDDAIISCRAFTYDEIQLLAKVTTFASTTGKWM